uniref:DNA-3-methyladenine glycosylase I n=1 Tax=Aegilops tauschii subsp. strangulata TaxID=200361 RepID=A0A453KX06_AEGTS
MSAAGPRVAGAARRPSSPRPPSSSAGGRERPPSAGAGGRERPQPTTRRGDEDPRAAADSKASNSKKRLPSAAAAARGALPSMLLRRSELLRRGGKNGNMQSLNVSCASEASDDSFCSRASTGRIGRPAGAAARRRAAGGSSAGPPSARKAASVAPDGAGAAAAVALGSMIGEAAAAPGPPRCPWVTRNTDPCYTAFHDQEWGVPVHDDRYALSLIKSSQVKMLTSKLII